MTSFLPSLFLFVQAGSVEHVPHLNFQKLVKLLPSNRRTNAFDIDPPPYPLPDIVHFDQQYARSCRRCRRRAKVQLKWPQRVGLTKEASSVRRQAAALQYKERIRTLRGLVVLCCPGDISRSMPASVSGRLVSGQEDVKLVGDKRSLACFRNSGP